MPGSSGAATLPSMIEASSASPPNGWKQSGLTSVPPGPRSLYDVQGEQVPAMRPKTLAPPTVRLELLHDLQVSWQAIAMGRIEKQDSCAIDLKSPAGKEFARRPAGVSDVVIENFRPGTMERLGLGYESLSQHNGRLILCAISGFGRTGPDTDQPAYDLIVPGRAE